MFTKFFMLFVLCCICTTTFSNPHMYGCPNQECLRIQSLGERYIEEGKGKEAYPLLKKAFEMGSYWAATDLGSLYQNGMGVKKNPEKAKYYYEFAANRGDDIAIYNIGEAYFLGNLYPQNYQKAQTYLERIKENAQAVSCASHLLGVMHIQGLGGGVDENAAKEDFAKAVKSGMLHFLKNSQGKYGMPFLFTNYAETYTDEMIKKYSPATKNAVFLSGFTQEFDALLIEKCLGQSRFVFKEKYMPNKIMD